MRRRRSKTLQVRGRRSVCRGFRCPKADTATNGAPSAKLPPRVGKAGRAVAVVVVVYSVPSEGYVRHGSALDRVVVSRRIRQDLHHSHSTEMGVANHPALGR